MAAVWKDGRTRGRPAWCIRYKGLDGKWHRERTEAVTKEQALKRLTQKLHEISEAKIRGVADTEAIKHRTFEEFVKEEYLPHCQATHTPSTYRGNLGFAKAVLPTFGKKILRAITQGDIQRFVDQRACRIKGYRKGPDGVKVPIPVKPATTNRELMFISGALSEAFRRGYVDRNPAAGIQQLPEHNDKLRWLTDDEEEKLLAKCPPYLRPIIRTALLTGMRQGEILGLQWSDVDFQQRLIRVTRTKNHRIRYIPINEPQLGLLKGLEPATGPDGPIPHVFVNPKTASRYQDVGHRFGEIARKARLHEVTFHTLRHTFASRLAQAGVPLNTIRELLGHGSMVMTMRYAHLAPNNLREAMELLGMPAGKNRTRIVQKGAPSGAQV